MSDAKAMGRLAAKMSAEEREIFLAAKIDAIAADCRTQKVQLELKGRFLTRKEQEFLAEIGQSGGLSRSALRQHLYLGCWRLLFVALSVPLEGYLAYMTFTYLNFGQTLAIVGAIGSVAVALKIIDHLITWYRKNNPERGDRLMQILASIGMVALVLMILFFADIRQQIHRFGFGSDDTMALEEKIENAQNFNEYTAKSFNYLMVAMTIAIVISTGLSLHEAHNRLALSIPLLRLYRQLNRVRNQMTSTAQALNARDHQAAQFRAMYEEGLALEQRKLNNKKNTYQWNQIANRIMAYAWHPVTLIALGICLFLFLKGQAHGKQWEIELDFSKSTLSKGYTEKDSAFDQNIDLVSQIIRYHLQPEDRIKVVGITEDSFARPYILLDNKLSKKKGAFGARVASEKLALLKQWQGFKLKPTAKGTDILGALFLSAQSLSESKEARVLVILSDMRNYSPVLDIETPARINVASALAKVEKLGWVPDLKGVRVLCLGVHGAGKTPIYWQGLKDFWQQFFLKAGVADFVFSMERRINHE